MNWRRSWSGRVAPCPIESNGDVRVWHTRAGRLVLVCDECDALWFEPGAIADTPESQRWQWELEGDEAIERPATREEIEAAGWAGHVTNWG